MPETISEGKTIEAAIESALQELGCKREDVEVEVIQEPVKGIFGMTKMAKVKVISSVSNQMEEDHESVTETEEIEQVSPEILHEAASQGQDSLKKMLTLMGIPNVKIKSSEEQNTVSLDIHCDSEGLLIGRHGLTLASMQYLLNRVVHHSANKRVRYIVDVGGYKVRHKTILEKMAKRIAQKVADTKEEEQLTAMSAYDRRIIHLCVKDHPDVTTYSLGEGNYRRVVIAPKGATPSSE